MIDWKEVAARAAKSAPLRVILFVRHAQRPPIAEDDATYGENLPLTESGRAMALGCGRDIAECGNPEDWAFAASPYRRTLLTASAVAEGMGRGGLEPARCDEIGIPGLWTIDLPETHRNYRKFGSAPFTDMVVRGEMKGGYRSIEESTDMMLAWMNKVDFGARCTVLVSHDIFIAMFMNGIRVGSFDSNNWVGFLQGAAAFEREEGGWDFEYVVPDKASWRNTYVQ